MNAFRPSFLLNTLSRRGAALAALLVILSMPPAAPAQQSPDTSHHRAVFTEVNKNLASYKEVKAAFKDEEITFELHGWFDGGTLRKIVAETPGEDGGGADEFYLENDLPLFVFSHYATNAGGKQESRLYFKDGGLVHLLGNDKKPVARGSDDLKWQANRLPENCANFVKALKAKAGAAAKPQAQAKAVLKTTTGTFTGIEEGDYAHWNMRNAAGEDVSYFILRPDASVEAVLASPEKYTGKKCQVQWKTTTENIPEAGGKMEVEQIVSVEWVKAK